MTVPPVSLRHRAHSANRSDSNEKANSEDTRFRQKQQIPRSSRLTLWDYLLLEIHEGPAVTGEDKVENLLNVIILPWYLEKAVTFGLLACLDVFLHMFTVLPLRIMSGLLEFIKKPSGIRTNNKYPDVIKGLILAILFWSLIELDTSRIYHSIRGQAAIKLYVMFNVLEIADKLCAALGQDILESLFSINTLNSWAKTGIFGVLFFAYSFVHSLILLYQVITLNVAVNSYSNALLTLLLSNQFSEIKGTVFKKFERENLFQLTCADITERFQLLIMLLVIGIRNVVEVSNTGIIPASWAGWNRWLGALFGPACVVVGSEIAVDWLKHAYIIKFNNLRPKVYRKFLRVLAIDYAENSFSDQAVTKRMGFPVFPLSAVAAKMIVQSYYLIIEQATPTSTNILSPSAGTETVTSTVADKIDAYFLPGQFRVSASRLYFIFTFSLVWIAMFLLLLIAKLVLGLLLLRYVSKKHFRPAPKYRSRRPTASDQSNTNEVISAPQTPTRESDFAPDKSSGFGVVKLDEAVRNRLYDADEEVPESWHLKQDVSSGELLAVTRFKMVAKRIW